MLELLTHKHWLSKFSSIYIISRQQGNVGLPKKNNHNFKTKNDVGSTTALNFLYFAIWNILQFSFISVLSFLFIIYMYMYMIYVRYIYILQREGGRKEVNSWEWEKGKKREKGEKQNYYEHPWVYLKLFFFHLVRKFNLTLTKSTWSRPT